METITGCITHWMHYSHFIIYSRNPNNHIVVSHNAVMMHRWKASPCNVAHSGHVCVWDCSALTCCSTAWVIRAPPSSPPDTVYCTCVQYSATTTGGFHILSLHSTLSVRLKNTRLHMRASQPRSLPKSDGIHSESNFTLSLFFKQRWKIPQACSMSCLRQRSVRREDGIGVWGVRGVGRSEGQMFHLKRHGAFFGGGFQGAKGCPVSFFSPSGCSVMCNSLQLFAQRCENIQSFHPDSDIMARSHLLSVSPPVGQESRPEAS